jgi:hypothetical protein
VQVLEPRPLDAAALPRAEQRLVDVGAGERADLRADHCPAQRGAEERQSGRQQRAADRGAGGGECERGHQR